MVTEEQKMKPLGRKVRNKNENKIKLYRLKYYLNLSFCNVHTQ